MCVTRTLSHRPEWALEPRRLNQSVVCYFPRLSQEISMAPMHGTIKRLVSDKGFGFILASDQNEYFFHNSACGETRFDDLREGQAVTFERGQGPKGPRAEHVKVT
jgi:CspA family cold shock protein